MDRAEGNLKKPTESAKRKRSSTTVLTKTVKLTGVDEWNEISKRSCVSDAIEAYKCWAINIGDEYNTCCENRYIYLGESNECNMRHGRGTCIWGNGRRLNGAMYQGQWRDGECIGLGTMTYPDGTLYQGLWEKYGWTGQGTLWIDGERCIQAVWVKCGYPLNGTMMEANGEVYLVEFNRKLVFNGRTWDEASDMTPAPASPSGPRMSGRRSFFRREVLDKQFSMGPAATTKRQLAGRVVEGGPPAPGGRVRAVRVELVGGGSYIGAMRGLSFCCRGVLTDAGGAAWRVEHADGGSTFAEGQTPLKKEVPPERMPLSFIPAPPACTCTEVLNPSFSPAQPLRLVHLAALAVVRAAGGSVARLAGGGMTEEELAGLGLDAAAASIVAAAWPAMLWQGTIPTGPLKPLSVFGRPTLRGLARGTSPSKAIIRVRALLELARARARWSQR